MIDIFEIRDRLNQLPFRQGKRQVYIGRISEELPRPESDDEQEEEEDVTESVEVRDYLRQLSSLLAHHDLELLRDNEDMDALYAVQTLRKQTNVDLSWMGNAIGWAYRIIAIAIVMVVPGILGYWLDGRFQTGPVLSLIGFVLGIVLGVWYLLLMTKAKKT